MLVNYIRTDVLLGKFFEPFIFEEVPANEQSPQQVYLKEVEMCDIYLGLFGTTYGYEDKEGVSPTEREYDLATQLHKNRLIFIKDTGHERDPKEASLIKKAEKDIVRKTFNNIDTLRTGVYASLVRYMEENGIIRWRPFDASTDNGATLDDLDEDKMNNFIHVARRQRSFALAEGTKPEVLLRHLDLLDDNGQLSNAAILLFGKKPQKYFITSEVKCMQFYGNHVEKPVPSYQIYKGDVFQLVDQATSFVMSRIDTWIGARTESTASVPTRTELPIEAVQEAIVNAVCHRDYTSNASVQVMLFRNRLEVWNPGQLPFGLTVKKLAEPHKSLPANPLIAEPMYLNKYIEKAGTGTEDIISKCEEYGLKKPEFYQEEDFRVVIWRKEKAEDIPSEEDKRAWDQVGTKMGPRWDQDGTKMGPRWDQVETKTGLSQAPIKEILSFCIEPKQMIQIIELFGSTNRSKFKKKYLEPLLEIGLLNLTLPNKPTSKYQQYVTTQLGKDIISENTKQK